jgi:hypothetical protein
MVPRPIPSTTIGLLTEVSLKFHSPSSSVVIHCPCLPLLATRWLEFAQCGSSPAARSDNGIRRPSNWCSAPHTLSSGDIGLIDHIVLLYNTSASLPLDLQMPDPALYDEEEPAWFPVVDHDPAPINDPTSRCPALHKPKSFGMARHGLRRREIRRLSRYASSPIYWNIPNRCLPFSIDRTPNEDRNGSWPGTSSYFGPTGCTCSGCYCCPSCLKVSFTPGNRSRIMTVKKNCSQGPQGPPSWCQTSRQNGPRARHRNGGEASAQPVPTDVLIIRIGLLKE